MIQRRCISLLIAVVLILATIGVVMLASASMVAAAGGGTAQSDPSYFVKRQLLWMGVALVAAIVCAKLPLETFRQSALPLAAICVVLLVLVRIPGIGVYRNGSWRWIAVGRFMMQPSEFAKVGLILLTAWWIARNRRSMHTFRQGVLIPLCAIALFAGLLIIEPDFGATMLFGAVALTLLFAGGARLRYLLGAGAAGLMAVGLVVLHNPNRMRRLMAFRDPSQFAQQEAWQLVNALQAFAAGGVRGTGLGNSIQKHYYLPEAHTDFIFPIIGEEFGLIATLLIAVLFLVLFFCGLAIAMRASTDFGRFTALGCTWMITFQSMINLAVATGSMPTKGLPLPFISYGGSSLLVCSAMVGMMVNVALASAHPVEQRKKQALFKDRQRLV